ncbi:hypothetical protein HAX54_013239 [Datura stramonium]|uniref:Uncharacterized protein n=1 Tax=Datura stramonium TaxID=4076 RepID=A0ABS8TL04_DATST|nr:hypothetical protein [Datura stramonium]
MFDHHKSGLCPWWSAKGENEGRSDVWAKLVFRQRGKRRCWPEKMEKKTRERVSAGLGISLMRRWSNGYGFKRKERRRGGDTAYLDGFGVSWRWMENIKMEADVEREKGEEYTLEMRERSDSVWLLVVFQWLAGGE